MYQLKFEKIKAILTSQYWLVLTLSGAFFSFFALNRGGVKVFMELSIAFLILNALTGEYRLKKIPVSYWIFSAICVYLLFVSVLVSPQQSHYRWMANLVRILGVVFAIHCLSQKKIAGWVPEFFAAILSLAVCWQFAARYFFHMPHGTFTANHYLATFAVLALPIIFYFFWIATGWHKILFVLIAFMDADLLLQTGSRPAFLGIIIGTLFVFIFLVKGRDKWIAIISICFILGTLYFTDYANFASRIEGLIVNLAEEERIQLWTKAWNKLKDNSLLAWIFGHGIGWFPIPYTQDSTLLITFVSPHSFILELLYLNGLSGIILIFGGLAFVLVAIINAAIKSQQRKINLLLRCLLVVLLTWLIHCSFTFSFYSKYSQYPLAFILGSVLALMDKTKRDMANEAKSRENRISH